MTGTAIQVALQVYAVAAVISLLVAAMIAVIYRGLRYLKLRRQQREERP
jgi:hypothetical protein